MARFYTFVSCTFAFTASMFMVSQSHAQEIQPVGLFQETGIQLVGCETDIAGGCAADLGCQGGCNSGCGGTCRETFFNNLTSFLTPGTPCFDDFISPMTNPVFFEDPRTLTEARAIFIHHQVPGAAGGGDVQLFAVQLRAALTENLSLVAAKDGFITSSNPLIEDGWADVSLGLKYNLYRDPQAQRLLSVGISYELPWGSTHTLQGNGDGVFDLYVSAGAEFGCGYHYLTTTGLLLPTDTTEESQMWFWSQHVDHRIGCSNFYWLGEANMYHYLKSGGGGINGVEGGDLWNLGSTGVAGSTIVTGALGVKYKPNRNREVGFAWEAPMTKNKDIIDNRLTVDMIFRY
ncbi:MAG: hypothetical protein COA78_10485 [Blastopirellula sp.]|nr:MAG: hypothetical protein COA78_10485 [Blastopirellula sp.]